VGGEGGGRQGQCVTNASVPLNLLVSLSGNNIMQNANTKPLISRRVFTVALTCLACAVLFLSLYLHWAGKHGIRYTVTLLSPSQWAWGAGMEQQAAMIEQDVAADGEESDRDKTVHYKSFTAGAIHITTETDEYP